MPLPLLLLLKRKRRRRNILKARLKLILKRHPAWVAFTAHLREYLLDSVGRWRGMVLVVFGACKGIYI